MTTTTDSAICFSTYRCIFT